MPTFSYKGYDFDVDHTPTEEEFAQMSAYVDTLPPKQKTNSAELAEPAGFMETLGKQAAGGLMAAGDFVSAGVSLPVSGLSMLGNLAMGKGLDKSISDAQALSEYLTPTKLAEKAGNALETDKLDTLTQKNPGYHQAMEPINKLMEQTQRLGDWSYEKTKSPVVGAATKTMADMLAFGLAHKAAVKGSEGTAKVIENFKKSKPTTDPLAEMREAQQQASKPVEPKQYSEQADLFDESFFDRTEEINAQRRAQAAAEQEGIYRDAGRNEPQMDMFYPDEVQGDIAKQNIDRQQPRSPYDVQDTPSELARQNRQFERNTPELQKPYEGDSVSYLDLDKNKNVVIKQGKEASFSRNRQEPMAVDSQGNVFTGERTPLEQSLGDIYTKGKDSLGDRVQQWKDYLAQQKEKFKGSQKEHEALTFELQKQHEIEQAYTARDNAQKAQNATDQAHWEKVEKYWTDKVSEPSQRSVEIEKPGERTTYRPNKQNTLSNFKKKQSGAWTPFASSKKAITAEELQKQYREKYGEEVDYEIAKAQADKLNAAGSKVRTAKAISKVPGMGKAGEVPFKEYDAFDRTEAIKDIKNSEDLSSDASYYTKQVAPRGYLGKEILNNPAVSAGYSVVKGVVDKFSALTEKTLFHEGGIWYNLTKGEKLFTPGDMAELTRQLVESKGNPNYQFKLNPQQTKLKEQISEQFRKQISEVNAVREGRGQKPITGLDNYFPGYFDGPFKFEVRTGTGKPIIMTGHSKFGAIARAKWLQSKGFEVGRVSKREAIQSKDFGTDNLVAEYELMMDMMADPETAALRNKIDDLIQAEANVASGYHNRMKDWKGFKGTMGDNPFFGSSKNYYNAKEAIKRSVEAHNQWMAANELAKFSKELTEAGKGKAPIAESLVNKYIQDTLDIKQDILTKSVQELGEAVTGVSVSKQNAFLRKYADMSVIQMLGASFRAASQNFVQVADAVLPLMLKHSKNPIDIMTPMLRGLGDFTQVLMLHQGRELNQLVQTFWKHEHNLPEKLLGVRSSEKYKYAIDKGIVETTMLEASPPFKRKLPNAIYKYGGGLITRASEQAARFGTFSTLTDFLVDQGWSKEKAMAQAAEWTEAHMVDYSATGKPAILTTSGALGTSLGRLQTYKMNTLGRYFSMLKYAKRTGDMTPVVAMLTINLAVAGAQGLLGMDIVANILDFVANKNDDEKSFSTRAWVSEHMPDWANLGILSSTTNLGFFNAFAQQVVGDDPVQSLTPIWQNAFEHGRTAVRRMTTDPRAETEAEIGRELKNIAPQILQRQVDEKYLTQNLGDQKLAISPYTGKPTYALKPGDKPLFNVQPFERSKASFLRHEMTKEEQRFTQAKSDNRKEISEMLTDSILSNKNSPFKDARLAQSFNKYFTTYGGTKEGVQTMLQGVIGDIAVSDKALSVLVSKANKGKLNTADIVDLRRAIKYNNLQKAANQ